jgi:peptidoglycan/LPS O-acetylase OafA/YrhL
LQNSIHIHPSFFGPAWSLTIEEWFYISFPILLLIIQQFIPKEKGKSIIFTIASFIVVCLLLRILLASTINPNWDGGFRKIMPLRLDAIAIGVLAAYIKHTYEHFWINQKKQLLWIGSSLMIILSIFYAQDYLADFEASFIAKTFLFSVFSFSISLIMPFLSSIKSLKHNSINKIITHISLISYSMYLNHALIIYFVDARFFNGTSNIIKFLLVWILTIFISTLQYKYFEKPMTDLRDLFSEKKENIRVTIQV